MLQVIHAWGGFYRKVKPLYCLRTPFEQQVARLHVLLPACIFDMQPLLKKVILLGVKVHVYRLVTRLPMKVLTLGLKGSLRLSWRHLMQITFPLNMKHVVQKHPCQVMYATLGVYYVYLNCIFCMFP